MRRRRGTGWILAPSSQSLLVSSGSSAGILFGLAFILGFLVLEPSGLATQMHLSHKAVALSLFLVILFQISQASLVKGGAGAWTIGLVVALSSVAAGTVGMIISGRTDGMQAELIVVSILGVLPWIPIQIILALIASIFVLIHLLVIPQLGRIPLLGWIPMDFLLLASILLVLLLAFLFPFAGVSPGDIFAKTTPGFFLAPFFLLLKSASSLLGGIALVFVLVSLSFLQTFPLVASFALVLSAWIPSSSLGSLFLFAGLLHQGSQSRVLNGILYSLLLPHCSLL